MDVMSNLIELKKLYKRQSAYMKTIQLMNTRLLEVQSLIAELTIKELKYLDSKSKNEAELLTSKEVCKLLNISASTLYRMRIVDELPCIKIEGRKNVMFRKSEIDNFMKK